jgi:hypothetical protein
VVLIITFTTSIYGQIDQGDEIFSANGGDQPVIEIGRGLNVVTKHGQGNCLPGDSQGMSFVKAM